MAHWTDVSGHVGGRHRQQPQVTALGRACRGLMSLLPPDWSRWLRSGVTQQECPQSRRHSCTPPHTEALRSCRSPSDLFTPLFLPLSSCTSSHHRGLAAAVRRRPAGHLQVISGHTEIYSTSLLQLLLGLTAHKENIRRGSNDKQRRKERESLVATASWRLLTGSRG